ADVRPIASRTRLFALAVETKPQLDPVVAGAAGVRRRPHPQRHLGERRAIGDARWPAKARKEVAVLRLGELRELVEADELEGGGPVLAPVVLALAVSRCQ